MKYLSLFLFLWVGVSCNQVGSPKTTNDKPVTDSIKPVDTGKVKDTVPGKIADSVLLNVSSSILLTLKKRDFHTLSTYIDPAFGLRFSPYAYMDSSNQVFTKDEVATLSSNRQKFDWGLSNEETGKPSPRTIEEYFIKFVYDVDFLHAEKKAINKFLGGGNSLNNLKEFYPGYDFAEFYFSGFDPKYDGMDWRTLRLVFKTDHERVYLVAVVHDQWTI